MKISVIIPAYNEEEMLADTLRAILAQDHPDYEIIVVDNASSDRTSEVAASFPGVKVLREERKGTMWACERGRCEAVGEIIARMDADCLPEVDWLSRGGAHFVDRAVTGVSGPYHFHDARGFFRTVSLWAQKTVYRWFNWLMQAVGRGAVTIGGNSFMRAAALADAGGFNTALTFYGDDTDTARRLAGRGRVVFDPELVMKTSARRFHKTGIVRLEARYIYHFLRVIFSRKSK